MKSGFRSGQITTAALSFLAATALLVAASGVRTPALAQAGRSTFDFEDGVQGFTALNLKNGAPVEDATVKLEQVKAKDQVKVGDGALSYSYKLEAGTVRFLVLPTKVAAGTKALKFWVRSNTPTILAISLREPDDSRYGVSVTVPAFDWTQVALNLDELVLAADSQDENGKLDLDAIDTLTIFDFATFLVNTGNAALANAIPNALGPRQLWLDHFQLATEAAPQSTGSFKFGTNEYHVVDNFDAGTVRWTPLRVNFGAMPPSFEIFPSDSTLKVLTEAAAPGQGKSPVEPGGKGLRYAYKRGAQQAYGLTCNLEGRKLGAVNKLKLSLNVSQKSLLVVQVKEKDGSEYTQTLLPDAATGWRNLEFPFDTLVLGNESKDENNKLDPDQIKEVTILDASGFAPDMAPPGDITLDLDSVVFQIK